MDLKLIDFFRCPPVIVFDALIAKRLNISSFISYRSNALNFFISSLGVVLSFLLFLCQKEWLVEFYRFFSGVFLLIFSFLLQILFVANSFKPAQAHASFFELISSVWKATGLVDGEIHFTQRLILCTTGQLLIYTIFISNFMYGRQITQKWAWFGYICSLTPSVAMAVTSIDWCLVASIYIALLPQFLLLYITLGRFFSSAKYFIMINWRAFKIEVHENGILNIVETMWGRLRVPHVLRIFFFFRLALISALLYCAYPIEHEIDKEYHPEGMYYFIAGIMDDKTPPPPKPYRPFTMVYMNQTVNRHTTDFFHNKILRNHDCLVGRAWFHGHWINVVTNPPPPVVVKKVLGSFQSLVVKLTDSLMSIFAISSVMYVPLYYFGVVVHAIVGGVDVQQAASLSIVSATLFCLLSIQTGLSGLPPHKRLIRLGRNLWLLFAAILHFIHDLVNPVLLQISSQVNIPLKTHVRPLMVLFLLLFIPIVLCYWLVMTEPLSTWMVAVVAFCVELVFKVLSTFLLYCLFTIDSRFDHGPWPHMDEYVFMIQSTAHVVEFICGCIMFVNGAYVFLFESGNLLRALMMTMHAYINIYKAACDGWKTFSNRCTVNKRIARLELATEEILAELDDVCSICYQDFTIEFDEARRTNCGHLFHSSCLKRWLFIRETCPMCHEKI